MGRPKLTSFKQATWFRARMILPDDYEDNQVDHWEYDNPSDREEWCPKVQWKGARVPLRVLLWWEYRTRPGVAAPKLGGVSLDILNVYKSNGLVCMPELSCPRTCVSPYHARWESRKQAGKRYMAESAKFYDSSRSRPLYRSKNPRAWGLALSRIFEETMPNSWWNKMKDFVAESPKGPEDTIFRAIAQSDYLVYAPGFNWKNITEEEYVEAQMVYEDYKENPDPALAWARLEDLRVPAVDIGKYADAESWKAARDESSPKSAAIPLHVQLWKDGVSDVDLAVHLREIDAYEPRN